MPSIAICAPARSITPADAARVTDLAAQMPGIALSFHPQCFQSEGHFAGNDAQRLAAFLECANDPAFDAVWFARGGYGSNRIAEDALSHLTDAARAKAWLGYSDTGYLLAALYRAGVGTPVHAPMPGDIRRDGGERRPCCARCAGLPETVRVRSRGWMRSLQLPSISQRLRCFAARR